MDHRRHRSRYALRKPRQSCMFVKPGLWPDDCSKGSKPGGAGCGQMLAVELAEPFFSAELVELGRDDRGRVLVGRTGELGVELQGGGALRVAETPGDGLQVRARGQQLGGRVMPQLLQRACDADPAGVPAVPVGHRVGVPWRAACRVGGERECAFRHPGSEVPRLGTAALESLAKQFTGQQSTDSTRPSPASGAFSIRFPCLTM